MRLIYTGELPPLRGKIIHPMARYRLKQRAQRVFGVLPPKLCATKRARVRIIRVLGPKQRLMDTENLATQMAGLVDALKPSYIVDDGPRWIDICWLQDASQRDCGPMIVVEIKYENPSS